MKMSWVLLSMAGLAVSSDCEISAHPQQKGELGQQGFRGLWKSAEWKVSTDRKTDCHSIEV